MTDQLEQNGNAVGLDAGYIVRGNTLEDSASGLRAEWQSVGNWGDAFAVIVSADASEWIFGALPPGAYVCALSDWDESETLLQDGREDLLEFSDLHAMAAAMDYLLDMPNDAAGYFLPRKLEDEN